MTDNSIQPNDIGLTRYQESETDGPYLIDQLQTNGIPYATIPIPGLVGFGGMAYVVMYTAPKTQRPITTLCVPILAGIEEVYEAYFTFEGMTPDQAAEQRWIDLYNDAKGFVR